MQLRSFFFLLTLSTKIWHSTTLAYLQNKKSITTFGDKSFKYLLSYRRYPKQEKKEIGVKLLATTTNSNRNVDNIWSKSIVPEGYQAVESLMSSSVTEYLSNEINKSKTLISVDVLTPGLNPRLEQKAMLSQEYLFNLVVLLIPAIELSKRFQQIQLMFPSMGDAAGFKKYCYQVNFNVPDWITLTDVNYNNVKNDDDCLVFITSKNNVGDPVIRDIQRIVGSFPTLTCIFLNCDLSDKVKLLI